MGVVVISILRGHGNVAWHETQNGQTGCFRRVALVGIAGNLVRTMASNDDDPMFVDPLMDAGGNFARGDLVLRDDN